MYLQSVDRALQQSLTIADQDHRSLIFYTAVRKCRIAFLGIHADSFRDVELFTGPKAPPLANLVEQSPLDIKKEAGRRLNQFDHPAFRDLIDQ